MSRHPSNLLINIFDELSTYRYVWWVAVLKNAILMSCHFDELPLWWFDALMSCRFDELPFWWVAILMSCYFNEVPHHRKRFIAIVSKFIFSAIVVNWLQTVALIISSFHSHVSSLAHLRAVSARDHSSTFCLNLKSWNCTSKGFSICVKISF